MQPIPTINVNLTTCTCAGAPEDADPLRDASGHIREFNGRPYCAAAPVLIPCHIPRSVTFEVVLGGCDCIPPLYRKDPATQIHSPACPARPIRVSCSISGETWAKSMVSDVDVPDSFRADEIREACIKRWGYVKSLVLGHSMSDCPEAVQTLRSQRDAVFAALADVARDEEHLFQRGNDAMRAINGHSYMRPAPEDRESAHTLARYVERLVEQVGVLP